jgi:hypothetical protein
MTMAQSPESSFDDRNPAVEMILRELAHKMSSIIKKAGLGKWHWSMFMFEYDTRDGSVFYISTAQREDFLNNLCTFMARQGYVVSKPGSASTDSKQSIS